MQGFQTPSEEFLQEMMDYNAVHRQSAIDLSGVPRSILSKIVHGSIMRSLRGLELPRVEISLGPDENYHHSVYGISSLTHDVANVFYKDGDGWLAVAVVQVTPTSEQVFISRLVDDATDEWELLDIEEEEEMELFSSFYADAVSYLSSRKSGEPVLALN